MASDYEHGTHLITSRKVIYWTVFILYLIVVADLCFADHSADAKALSKWLPNEIWGISIDKFIHFLMFLPFPILGFHAFYSKKYWRNLVFTMLISICFAFAFEFLQSTLTGGIRVSDPADFVANITAITTGSVIMAVKGIIIDRKLSKETR